MATVREEVITRLMAAFVTTTGQPFDGYTKLRNADAPTKKLPVLVFQDGAQTANHDNSGITFYTMAVTVEGSLESTGTEQLGTDLNALYGKIVAAALADHTLGGYSVDIREIDADPTIENEGSKFIGLMSVGFEIDFMTRERDPSTLAP